MELSNYQAFMECMRKWEKIGCNILCGLALWEQMQDCDRRGVPYTDIDIEAVSQDVVYRLIVLHDELRRDMLLCRFVFDKGFQLHRIFSHHSKTSMYRSTLGFTRSWSAYCISL